MDLDEGVVLGEEVQPDFATVPLAVAHDPVHHALDHRVRLGVLPEQRNHHDVPALAGAY